jgi:selenide,water dikinase
VTWKGEEKLRAGKYTHEDALVVRMPDGKLLASTVDVVTPIVDDPYLFGRVAATNSISDIYAMGGEPRFALSVLAYPPAVFGAETVARILQGAIDTCFDAGAVLGGGHTVRTQEVLFGLCVVGDFPGGRVLEKAGARDGDLLVLTKPLGNGILSTAVKGGRMSADRLTEAIGHMVALNRAASRVAVENGATACTDVTGFGFLGHLAEMGEAGGVGVTVRSRDVPVLAGALDLAAAGVAPGGTRKNLVFVSDHTRFAPGIDDAMKLVLADAQTSGGLLIALPPEGLAGFRAGCEAAAQAFAVVGRFEGPAGAVRVE